VFHCDGQVVDERTSWLGGYVGINSFGFGGSNVHVLLRSPDDTVPSSRPVPAATTSTRLVTCAGRTKEGVETALTEILQRPTDVDMQSLLQSSVGDLSPMTHPYRGVALVNSATSRQTVEVLTFVHLLELGTGPVWAAEASDCLPLLVQCHLLCQQTLLLAAIQNRAVPNVVFGPNSVLVFGGVILQVDRI